MLQATILASVTSMNTSASLQEQQAEGSHKKRSVKINNTCVPCRARKVKCDAGVIGLPCSSCSSRECAEDCMLPFRKSRTRKVKHALSAPSQTTTTPTTLDNSQTDLRSKQPKQSSTSDSLSRQSSRQLEPDLLYLNILNDAVKGTIESDRQSTPHNTNYCSRSEDYSTTRNYQRTKLFQLDEVDSEYLKNKGVFDLPPPHHLDAFVKSYFHHTHPFAPVLNRADFVHDYQSGDYSLFLLYVILTSASLHVPANVLSDCGFSSRSTAQGSFFYKAKLLHDFAVEDDPLLMLQGFVILCTVILDRQTSRDFSYWFHNAIHVATKLDLRNACIREDKPDKVLKLYRRIWWALYSLDIFHVSVNTRRSQLLEETSTIKPRMEDDCDIEDLSGASPSLLSAVTPQQRASPAVNCELSRIFGKCLSIVKNNPQQDPCQILHTIDTWRESLASNMHLDRNSGSDIYYLNMQAMSYRFECILCRLIRRYWQQSQHADRIEWVKQRLRSSILELDTIAMRVSASGILQHFPATFVTTLTALLALHIESSLDPLETELVRSMARISVNQLMLILGQAKEIPVLKRALPIFEEILTKRNLYLVSPNSFGQQSAQRQSHDNNIVYASASPHTNASAGSPQLAQNENDYLFEVDFLGFDFLDEWQMGQL